MIFILKKTLIVFIILLLSFSQLVCCVKITNSEKIFKEDLENVELDLLRAEHYLYLKANEDVGSFNLRYTFPPEYGYQLPIFLEILDDSNANIIKYKIENDRFEPNKFVNFTIGPMEKDEIVFIHFNFWVLVKNYNYSDLPSYVEIPSKNDLPNETKQWLSSTQVVQTNKILIKLRARQMKFLTNNIFTLADRIAKFSKSHRYWFFLIQYTFQTYKSQDAFTTLLRNGECPGRSHLGCALFRANGVPARVLIGIPCFDFWCEMHYMMEYYCNPVYGWILTNVHNGTTPYEPKYDIIQRICYTEDENNTQTDFINPKMKGIERWIWIDNENVSPYYKDLKEGSKSKGVSENSVFIDSMVANDTVTLTKDVFSKFENYLNFDLTGENKEHFQNATQYQMKALDEFKDATNTFGYIYYMNYANIEYDKIII